MYGNRSYGRGGFGQRLPRAVKSLLIANAVIFMLINLFPVRLNYFFGLVPYFISTRFMVWQFFTYMFLHAGFSHIFFNMFALWMFGTELEYNWGKKDFLYFYLTCGVGGGVLVWVTSMMGFSSMVIPTIGASGAIFGILVAYGMMWPDRLIFIFGVLPMKALHFVILFGALDLMQGLSRSGGGVAYFAHVGGGVTGFIYLKYGWRILVHLENWGGRLKAQFMAKKNGFQVHQGGVSEKDRQTRDTPDNVRHPDKNDEIDRILDKIARGGMESLSDGERRILDRASKRKKR